jgi:pantoate--beta-alanine ligase
MTEYLANPAAAREWCEHQRGLGKSIGYVPTMGALHDGHLTLVDRSCAENDVTCVSIFVNPLQFNNPQDLEEYPQNIEQDLKFLTQRHCNMTYSGKLEDFFPGEDDITKIKPSFVASAIVGLEADHRPGHLEGVQAIVEKLFSTVGPCRAYFGEKDFQQCFLVREIAAWIENIEIVVCPTIREESGLAMSSRNQRLSADGKKLAQHLYKALLAADKAYCAGQSQPAELEKLMRNVLAVEGINIEYTAIRATNSWTATTPHEPVEPAQALVAVTIEGVRLIDNMGLGLATSRTRD